MTDLKSAAVYVLLATTVLFGAGACAERSMRKAVSVKLETQSAVIVQRAKEADDRLRTLNASVLAQQKTLDENYIAGEKNDKTNVAKVNTLQTRLRELRDASDSLLHAAGAAGFSARTPEGRAVSRAIVGATDGAQAYRLFPVSPDQETDDDSTDADKINAAYVSCRLDAYKLRAAAK
jgi:hypothetical protein